jgi:peptide/nickel transport system permease protein
VYVAYRLVLAAVILVIVAVVDYGMIRVLRPELFPGEALVPGLWHDLDRAFLHFDFGPACMFAGCPPIRRLWSEGFGVDLYLLGGALVLGVGGGVAAGIWCAARPRSLGARAVESTAMVAYCTPVYVVGLGLLLAFSPAFGRLPLPAFFDPHSYAPLQDRPWDWFRSLLVPWLVVAAPLGAACARLTLATIREGLHEDYVRTGFAKGLSHSQVVRRHAAPASYPTVASFLAIAVPGVVTNMVLVEWVFALPGFFRHTKRAIGQAVPVTIDIPSLQALAMWAAVLIVVLSLVADLVLVGVDPRLRAAGRAPG